MADKPTDPANPETAAPVERSGNEGGAAPEVSRQLEGGAYEIIRKRLDTHGRELRKRLAQLNAERQAVFGAVEPALIATDRVSTANNCVPRDMIAIGGNRFIFGFNVHIGLKSTTSLEDVFAVYEYNPDTHTFQENGLDILRQGGFPDEFAYLYKYYKETVFVKFMKIGPHLYMAFRVGKSVDDIKTFKFLLKDGGQIEYIGNRFDHEYRFPPQQEFEWKRAHRDMQRHGLHPHVSIEDRLFVETVGGDLTIKIEDNTDSGEGIYAEDVTSSDQTLDDAEIFYATVGSLILLKILPYQERHYRHLVYNEKVKTVRRIDAINHSCVLLPDDHGIIFSNGYHLQTGETKIFESDLKDMVFERRLPSPNGEDYLYIFYNRLSGVYVLMSYNVIDQTVDTPIVCNGYSVFPDGELIYFRTEDQPQKHHVLQVWQTPYMQGQFASPEKTESYLYKVGNADIVRCMSECHEVLNLLGKDDTYADLYVDLTKKAGDICDAYFWVNQDAAFNLAEPLRELKGAAASAIAEFDKVRRLRKSTADETRRVSDKARKLVKTAQNNRPDDILGFVHTLAELRTVRGEIISLRDLRYIDLDRVQALEAEVETATGKVSQQCVEFLLKPEALDPYRKQVQDQKERIPKIAKVTEAEEVEKALSAAGAELEMLIDIVGNLKIADATQTTQIIDDISSIYATLNQVRVTLKNRKKDLARVEGVAQFGAQMKLLNQAVINYLDLCDHPDKCDEYLSKMMVQLEELEGRFSDFDEYIEQLTEKRDEIYNAFEARKLALVESRNKRSGALAKSAERILNSIRHRLGGFDTINEINGYLASDLMIEKVRDIIGDLEGLGDTVKAGDIQAKLKTIREDAVRQLKDRQELFVDGKDVIQLGNHRFTVNRQELELSIVPHDEKMCFHLSGTNFFEPIHDEEFLSTRDVWDQEVVSEDSTVYRAEYLAWQILKSLTTGKNDDRLNVESYLALSPKDQQAFVHRFMAPRYREGYTKGLHDQDAHLLLDQLLSVHKEIGLLRFHPVDRALGLLYWEHWQDEAARDRLHRKLLAFGVLNDSFSVQDAQRAYLAQLERGISQFAESIHSDSPEFEAADPKESALYLFRELSTPAGVTVSGEAAELTNHFRHTLAGKRIEARFQEALDALSDDPVSRYEIIRDWMLASSGVPMESGAEPESAKGEGTEVVLDTRYLPEAAAHWLRGGYELRDVKKVRLSAELVGMSGSHRLIDSGKYAFDYLTFTQKLRAFERTRAPRFEVYESKKVQLIESKRETMRLEEFKPRVMSAFVRNKLLDRVYLPLVGDNLAKQIGVAGESTRTDRMGLLLLVSPPGYGKTTLMEYIANRVGLTFMKINGPALGHDVKSLDPQEAPNASAREEIHKLNLSLEMGDNVMIYVDDIQHTHSEFLQKFISLCDAQRKIEGVYNGKPRTYDLRGKKVCVVMAGNPYTESGGKFQIPDMLANRADTYNLGDIIGDNAADFEASYIENALTSNPILGKLASRSQKDVYAIMKIAESGSQEGVDFEGNYSMEEIDELVSVMKKLMRVRDTILRVNLEYIRSAAMEDAYRTEPPFRLQGSYRNMNRIAEKILPIMTDQEVEGAIFSHYDNEAQTLTTGAEANLLKFHELEGKLSTEQAARWDEIRKTFNRNQLMGGRGETDPVARVVGALAGFADGLGRIEGVLGRAVDHQVKPATLADVTVEKLEKIIQSLRAVPVDVEIKVVPVHDGEEPPTEDTGTGAKKEPEAPGDVTSPPKKKAAQPPRKKQSRKVSGKEQNLPVDIESTVEQQSIEENSDEES